MNPTMTESLRGPQETYETYKTYCVGTREHPRVVFGSEFADRRPVLGRLAADIARISSEAWRGLPCQASPAASSHVPVNIFLRLADFGLCNMGQYGHRTVRSNALNAVVDDVGLRAAMEKLVSLRSWMLEKSLSDRHAAQLRRDTFNNREIGHSLKGSVPAPGLCQPALNGPRTWLGRLLPLAGNGKHTLAWQYRMVTWRFQRRSEVEEQVHGSELEKAQLARPVLHKNRAAPANQDDGIWVPPPKENPVLVALRDLGLYGLAIGSGKHDVTCPWADEHEGGSNSAAAYTEPDQSSEFGGFICLHDRCAERDIHYLLCFLNIAVADAQMKARIRVVAGKLDPIVDAAERALSNAGEHYQRSGRIVTLVTDPGMRETSVQEVTQPGLRRALARAAIWEGVGARGKGLVPIDPPSEYVTSLLGSEKYPHLPVLKNLTRQPYLRADDSLMTTAGYDAASRMFGLFNPEEFSVPAEPTRAQAEASLAVLVDLLAEFKFGSGIDLAAALTAMITAAVRPSLNTAPMFHVRARAPGSGKSCLCDVAAAFATPQHSQPTNFPRGDEEFRKLLLAKLLAAPAVIVFDNVTHDFVARDSLCTALATEHMSDRILGASRTVSVNTRVLFLSSGNNVGPVQDMARRCITILLDPRCEVPAARTFKRPHLVRDVLRERGRYVSAALTIVRAWVVAGRPMSKCKPLVGYDDWSDRCRQPLLWLGLPDSIDSVFEAMVEDPDREIQVRFMTAWQGLFGNTATMVRDAVKQASGSDDEQVNLREVLHDIAGERGGINPWKLGRWIKRHEKCIVDDRQLVRGSSKGSAEAWQVESVS